MKKFSKRIVFCKCVRKTCPMKFHVIVDPDLREILREEISQGVFIHVRSKSTVFIEGREVMV